MKIHTHKAIFCLSGSDGTFHPFITFNSTSTFLSGNLEMRPPSPQGYKKKGWVKMTLPSGTTLGFTEAPVSSISQPAHVDLC